MVPQILAIFALFFVAVIAAMILKRTNIPYTIGLVIIGVLLAYTLKDVKFLHFISEIRLTHDIILYIFNNNLQLPKNIYIS